jgi:DnaJ-domain-containing protein 1
MGMWDRLGKVIEGSIRDFIDGDDARIFGGNGRASQTADPDMDAAFKELNEYLNRRSPGDRDGGGTYWKEGGVEEPRLIPEELRPDFAELGLPLGASAEECKAAYKRLLKIHHPDRHAGHDGNFKKATVKSTRLNIAYDRIEKWRKA